MTASSARSGPGGTGALANSFLWKTRRVWQLFKTANTVC